MEATARRHESHRALHLESQVFTRSCCGNFFSLRPVLPPSTFLCVSNTLTTSIDTLTTDMSGTLHSVPHPQEDGEEDQATREQRKTAKLLAIFAENDYDSEEEREKELQKAQEGFGRRNHDS